MSVERKSNGKWLARWRDPDGRQRAETFARKLDADRHIAKMTVDTLSGAYVDPRAGRITVAGWWSRWSANQVQWSPGTRERYTGAWHRHIEPKVGSRSLGKVTHSDLRAVLAGSGLQPSTLTFLRAVLTAMFTAARKDRLIPVSPAEGLQVPKVAPEAPRPLDDGEIDRLVAVCDPWERVWVLTGLGTGVRISESLAVRTAKLDFLRRELHVDDQARTPKAGEVELGPVKNRKPRTVPLADSLAVELGRHIEATIPLVDGRRDGFLFPAHDGRLLRRARATARFASIAKRAGLEDVTWHNLRDTAATTMLRNGLNPAYVAKVIGNTVPVLLARYAGVLPDDVDLARKALDRITLRAAALGMCMECAQSVVGGAGHERVTPGHRTSSATVPCCVGGRRSSARG